MKVNSFLLLIFLSAVLLAAVFGPAGATTWGKNEVKCPVCGETNQFRSIMTYGGYVYDWPSKYQYVYFPMTDSNCLYCCRGCALCLFMDDFSKAPATMAVELKKAAEPFKSRVAYTDSYNRVDMDERFAAAEKAYEVIGRSDEFWCDFYRTRAYHLAVARKKAAAAEAWTKALGYAEKALKKPDSTLSKKELYYISGAMKRFLKDKKGAVADFKTALGEKFANPKMKKEELDHFTQYLDKLIAECVKVLENPEQMKKEMLDEIARLGPDDKRRYCMQIMGVIEAGYNNYYEDNKKIAESLDALSADEYIPEKSLLFCPEGGTYSVEFTKREGVSPAAAGNASVPAAGGDAPCVDCVTCSKHGRKSFF